MSEEYEILTDNHGLRHAAFFFVCLLHEYRDLFFIFLEDEQLLLLSGKVEEAPRGVSASTLFLENCFGYNKGRKKIEWWHCRIVIVQLEIVGRRQSHSCRKAVRRFKGRNPGDFDLKSYYELSGIAGRIYVKNKSDVVDVSHGITFNFVRDIIDR